MPRPSHISERGAALVAVLLLTMVLSTLGLIAMRNTVHSMQMSGSYRIRQQADLTSDSALTFVSARAGDKPAAYLGRMRATAEAAGQSEAAYERGAFDIFGSEAYKGTDRTQGQIFDTSNPETGLFLDPAINGLSSHESDGAFGTVSYRVVMRDMVEGPPPVGSSSNKFCSKKIFFASEARYEARQLQVAGEGQNENFASWQRPSRSGQSLTGLEGWVGPVACGYGN